MLKVGVLVSGGGTNLQAILDAIDCGKITNAEVSLVISNNPKAYALERAKNHNIEAVCISPKQYESREEFHKALLEKLKESGADIAYVMPSHQYPLGIVMPIKRRQELLRWAEEKPGRYLIEDDYDSEFRYIGKPIPSLQGNDRSGCVIYLGTFSKSIAPAIRISYLVLPESLLETYRRIDNVFSSTVSRLDQRVLQLFMEKGYYERHLNKMRALYKSKHDVLMSEIRKMRGVRQVLGDHSGVHILLQMDSHLTEQELIQRARQAGIKVYPLSEYCVNEADYPPTVILGYATLSEEEIREGVRLLAQAWLS